jgi:hypothetical protein
MEVTCFEIFDLDSSTSCGMSSPRTFEDGFIRAQRAVKYPDPHPRSNTLLLLLYEKLIRWEFRLDSKDQESYHESCGEIFQSESMCVWGRNCVSVSNRLRSILVWMKWRIIS